MNFNGNLKHRVVHLKVGIPPADVGKDEGLNLLSFQVAKTGVSPSAIRGRRRFVWQEVGRAVADCSTFGDEIDVPVAAERAIATPFIAGKCDEPAFLVVLLAGLVDEPQNSSVI